MNNPVFEETLYINHSSGQTGSWSVKVNDIGNGVGEMVVSATKVLGGKSVETTTIFNTGKNIGRANETTPLEQAISEAKSKAQKKMDKGYTRERPEAGQKAVNGMGLTKPMLAQDFKAVESWPVYAQPKLDGNRCLAARIDGKILLWSRGGKPINLPHVAAALDELLPDDFPHVIDGELYCHGETLQTITSWIKKLKPESERISYIVYDVVTDACYRERLHVISEHLPYRNSKYPVSRIDVWFTTDEEVLDLKHAEYIANGYEGTMVRTLGVGYEDGKRSKSLQKLKDFQDAEFEIIDVIQGKPRITYDQQLEVAVYICKCGAHTFNATAPGDMYEKDAAWTNRADAIGKQLTVKFFNYTPDGLPFLPVALRIREDL
jgi:DNA ligase 1